MGPFSPHRDPVVLVDATRVCRIPGAVALPIHRCEHRGGCLGKVAARLSNDAHACVQKV